ncbi:MAG: DUF5320 domain-containing protein [Spirochaetia bacterium]|nr:DUF5320 domain-containing protein [Spirochaetia bacterium]
MPNFNGTGPIGAGPMTGRGLGPCCGAQAYGRGMRRGNGSGMGSGGGLGMGRGMGGGFGRGAGGGFGRGVGGGLGPRMGWFPAGYGADDLEAREEGLKSTLEQRAAFLKAELERTESMLNAQNAQAGDPGADKVK